MMVDFTDAPDDTIERLMWLSGVKEAVDRELDAQWSRAYFEARLQGQFDAALDLGYHSHKKVMAYTRGENERRGRLIRWGDKRG